MTLKVITDTIAAVATFFSAGIRPLHWIIAGAAFTATIGTFGIDVISQRIDGALLMVWERRYELATYTFICASLVPRRK